jgi:hypothetical protein
LRKNICTKVEVTVMNLWNFDYAKRIYKFYELINYQAYLLKILRPHIKNMHYKSKAYNYSLNLPGLY